VVSRRDILLPFHDVVDVVKIPDFMQPIDWSPILYGADIVIHAAGLARPDSRFDNADLLRQVNVVATQELASAAADAGIGHFIYISSIRAQVGASSAGPVREEDEPLPTDNYGRSKLAAESALRASRVPFTILRPVAVYGTSAGGNFRALMRIASMPVPLPFAAFNNRRSLLSIENFNSAVIFALNSQATIGETYLVADPEPITVREIFMTLREAQKRRPWLINVPPKLIRVMFQLINRPELWDRLGMELVADTTKLKSVGWCPLIDTYGGLGALLKDNIEDFA
jgi:UDP-glucose 4-epimerase